MKALSIVAVVIAGIAFFIPVFGVWMAVLSSVMGLIAFRSSTTLSAVAVGLNLANTAFASPSLLLAEAVNIEDGGSAGAIYWTYVGIHVVILVVGIILAKTKKS